MRVQTTRPAAAQPAKTAVKAAAPKATAPSMDLDSADFGSFRKATPAQLDQARKAIAALAQTPSIPLKNAEKGAWLEAAKKRQAEAEKGLEVLRDAEFFNKQLSTEEVDALSEAVSKHADQIESCEQRAGLKPMPKPLNPFRPLGEYTRGLNSLPNNVFGALVKSIGIMATIPMDIVDGITRPVQAVLWPVAWAWRGVQKAGSAIGIG
jgi:hypothetical protein